MPYPRLAATGRGRRLPLRLGQPLEALLGERAEQGGLVREMAVERGRADPHGARYFAQAKVIGGALFQEAEARLDRRRAQVAMMVGF